ncbi:hypothetical protein DKX38_027179 [Salix brachista]|uniref:DNA-directed RNA polymerase N-terminal domain-containing protein n=1 Tax=Salix brachista TaxID=2182728 RepID=A0A5N5JBK2_9ROSI|nr:hypothetical protein DKX38_027179 [Salix brachista]
MWRNVAKQATLKSQSKPLNFPPFPRTHSFVGASKEPIFFGKFKFHSLNNTTEAVSSTDVEDNVSSADEVQELLPEMRKQEEKEERFRGRRTLNANPGIGSRKHRHKLAPNLPCMKSLFLGWFEPFTDAIAKEQELIRTGKSRQAYAPYFDLLPADKMSAIAMHQLAATVMTCGEHGCARVETAACMIGDAIEQESSSHVVWLKRDISTFLCQSSSHVVWTLFHYIRIHNILEKTRKKKEKADDSKNGVEGESPAVMKEQENLRKKVTDLIKKQKLPDVFISNFKCARSKEATDDYVGEMAQTDLLSQTDLNPIFWRVDMFYMDFG